VEAPVLASLSPSLGSLSFTTFSLPSLSGSYVVTVCVRNDQVSQSPMCSSSPVKRFYACTGPSESRGA
jgi:hypothetical protein